MGHRFLKHLERTRVLVHVVDVSGASGREPVQDLAVLCKELALFDAGLAAKPQLVAANKIDAIDRDARDPHVEALARRASELKLAFFRVSAATGAGVPELLEAMWHRLAAARQSAA